MAPELSPAALQKLEAVLVTRLRDIRLEAECTELVVSLAAKPGIRPAMKYLSRHTATRTGCTACAAHLSRLLRRIQRIRGPVYECKTAAV